MPSQGFDGEANHHVLDYSSVDVLVIGAGPTGLGAAKRLNQIVRIVPSIAHNTSF